MLNIYGVEWIPSRVIDFVETKLAPSSQSIASGNEKLRRRFRASSVSTELAVSVKRQVEGTGSKQYLRGREPDWADLVHGYAANLSKGVELGNFLFSLPSEAVYLVEGTAGSGRTTAMMQAALALDSMGRRVAWIESRNSQQVAKISDLVDKVIDEGYEVIFIDDADGFGERAPHLIRDLWNYPGSKRTVVVGARSVRSTLIRGTYKVQTIVNGDLTPDDIELLIDKLEEKNAIYDRRASRTDVRNWLTSTAERQLLVGMIQATSGVPFSVKVATECDSLDPIAKLLYGVVCVVTAEAGVITRDQALDSVDSGPGMVIAAFDRLVRENLIREVSNTGYFESRHRIVAAAVRDHLNAQGLLGMVLKGAVRVFAAAAADLREHSAPERRVLARLSSHTYLIDLGLTVAEVRDIYEEVEHILDEDFNFWLHRGAFELEVEGGDISAALASLTAARTLAGGENDYKVITTHSRLRLLLARTDRSAEATALALEAVRDLHNVIRRHGTVSPHTFVILGQYGAPWLVDAPISKTEKSQLVAETLRWLKFAERLDAVNDRVRVARLEGISTLEKLEE